MSGSLWGVSLNFLQNQGNPRKLGGASSCGSGVGGNWGVRGSWVEREIGGFWARGVGRFANGCCSCPFASFVLGIPCVEWPAKTLVGVD